MPSSVSEDFQAAKSRLKRDIAAPGVSELFGPVAAGWAQLTKRGGEAIKLGLAEYSGSGGLAAREILRDSASLVDTGDEPSRQLAAILFTAAARLDEPMRLAVAGQINRGKSTLVNALLGREVLKTARRELTFNVNELFYADPAHVTVHFRDGTEPRSVDEAELARWTSYDQINLADLKRVRRVDYGLPNALLRRFRLVDTPGLGSVHDADTAAALSTLGLPTDGGLLDRLGRNSEDVDRDSATELEQADAVLYLFSRGIHERDRDVLTAFAGEHSGVLTPLRAFGVLSKCDDYWPPDPGQPGVTNPLAYHPLQEAKKMVLDRYLDDPRIRALFYTVVPVAAKVAVGACGLDGGQLAWLADLAQINPGMLAAQLADAARFAEGDPARRSLIHSLGPWGIHLACTALREHLGEGEIREHLGEGEIRERLVAEIRERLVAESGVIGLRDLVTQHFGNRAKLIKMNQSLRSASSALAEYRAQRGGDVMVAEAIGRRLEEIQQSDRSVAEFAALSAYYRGRLMDLTDDEKETLLKVTGEDGTDCASRLGLRADASVATMSCVAEKQLRYWAERHNDPNLDRESGEAARTLLRLYDEILHRIRRAHDLLAMEE
jgi:Dynamin family